MESLQPGAMRSHAPQNYLEHTIAGRVALCPVKPEPLPAMRVNVSPPCRYALLLSVLAPAYVSLSQTITQFTSLVESANNPLPCK
jgi:hypothetical protein